MKKISLLALISMVFVLVPAAVAPIEDPPLFCLMVGHINSFGGNPARGWLHSTSNLLRQVAYVKAHFVPSENLTLPPHPPIGNNFTFSFYALRLENTTKVALNYSGYNYYISGLWDVYNITFVYESGSDYIVATWIIHQLLNDSPGELYVTNHWMNFTVAIEGFDLIEGAVRIIAIRLLKPLPLTDVNCDRAVNLSDLVEVARRFGTRPGNIMFDFRADINPDFLINLSDLVKTAADFGDKY